MSLTDDVPGDVWQRIFHFLASTASLGPPSIITAIILTDRRLHDFLCICRDENAHLYSSIFANCCDISAPRRRFGVEFSTSSCRSKELRARFECIKRIRQRNHQFLDPDILTEDLCRCFCMLMESDHKNGPLLFKYAGLTAFVIDSARDCLSDPQPLLSHRIPHVSFLLWLVWLVSTYDNLVDEDQNITNELQEKLFPYIISAWLYPDYLPKPIPFPDNSTRPSPNSPNPVYYAVTIFAHRVSIIIPPISPAAILSFCSRADANLIRLVNQDAEVTQLDGRVENAMHLLSASVAGLDNGVEVENSDHSFLSHVFSTPSERFEDDWQRLRASPDVEGPPPPRSHNATFSLRLLTVISGTWEGRMEYPDYRQYMSLRGSLAPDIESYNNMFMSSVPLECLFDVYYCTNSSDVLRIPQDGHSILNGWFPPRDEIDITYTASGDLRIWDRATTRLASYKRFYDTEYDVLQGTEILDIIIIGASISADPGLAARFTGRVAKDGLIVFLRDGPQRGQEFIRGYIHHGRNFVGRWRTTALPAESSSWEGPFILARRDD